MPEKKINPKTMQTYLKSLEHFFDFVISKNTKWFNYSHVQSVKYKLQMCKSLFDKEARIATMVKMEEDQRTKTTPEDIY